MAKILIVTDCLGHGGSIKNLTWLANGLSKRNNVWFCSLCNAPMFYTLNNEVSFIQRNSKKSNSFIERNTIGLTRNIFDIYKIVKSNKIDIVINYGDHAVYSLLFIRLITNTKLIFSQRVDPFSCNKLSEKIKMWFYRFADGIVCQTKWVVDYFNRKNIRNIIIIPNPANSYFNAIWNAEENDNYIVSLARIDLKQKRQDVLLKAMRIVNEKRPEITLRFYGLDKNDNVSTLNKLISHLGLKETAFYCGITEDVFHVLSRACMMVLSSDYEGIPNAIIDAMTVGVPVISTDYSPGGVRELLNCDNGLIVPKGDYQAMADAILTYLNDKDLAKQNAINAHNSLKRFDEKLVLSMWEEYIKRTIGDTKL